jgi:prepilin-type N-terminal cleavage/methylation domain-containing protein
MSHAPVHPAPRLRAQRVGLTMRELLVVIAIIGVLAAIVFPNIYSHPAHPTRYAEGSNLRTIGQAMLAAETEQPGLLTSTVRLSSIGTPLAAKIVNPPSIHAIAAQLARSGLDQPAIWLSKVDAHHPYPTDLPTSILAAMPPLVSTRPSINPKFLSLPLAFAVALFPPGTEITKLPTITPLAWTRGLQPNGTWSETSAPYGDWGGYIVFVGGNLEKFKTIDGKLVKFGTTQPTSDIREALPPGTRILESQPKP